MTSPSKRRRRLPSTKTKRQIALLIAIALSCSFVFIQSPAHLDDADGDKDSSKNKNKINNNNKNDVIKLRLEEFRSAPVNKNVVVSTASATTTRTGPAARNNAAAAHNVTTSTTDTKTSNTNTTTILTTIKTDDPNGNELYPIVVRPYNGSVDPFYNISSDGTNLWDADPRLPAWIKAYLNWHKWKRQTWDPKLWVDDRWMIMQCLVGQDDRRCGGTADRLKPLPTLLRIAYENHRMLLIRWTRPATLETYLVPPKGGVDWRVPDWLADVLENATIGRRFVPSKVIRKYAPTNLTLLRTRYQSMNAGSDSYDAARHDDHEPTFDQVFAPLWRLFFRPSPAIAQIIEDQLESNGLVPGQYVAAHLRALYAIDERPLDMIQRWTVNAVNCASQIRPGAPIFFASDSSDATAMAQTYVAQKQLEQEEPQQQQQQQLLLLLGQDQRPRRPHLVIHTPNPNPPVHIDQDPNWRNRTPSDFYDTFVDLYLISLAGCVAFSIGGYGHWGLLIGGNLTCKISHKATKRGTKFANECDWHPGGPNSSSSSSNNVTTTSTITQTKGGAIIGMDAPSSSSSSSSSLFLEPMP